jgi:hypothetical protein
MLANGADTVHRLPETGPRIPPARFLRVRRGVFGPEAVAMILDLMVRAQP